MRFGFGLPHAGEAANGPDIIRIAQRAEALGFASVWSGDHIVLPVGGTTQYPYTTDLGLTGAVLSRSNAAVVGTTQEVIDDIRRCQDIGIQQLTFDFRSGQVDDMLKIIEHFAAAVMPAVCD